MMKLPTKSLNIYHHTLSMLSHYFGKIIQAFLAAIAIFAKCIVIVVP